MRTSEAIKSLNESRFASADTIRGVSNISKAFFEVYLRNPDEIKFVFDRLGRAIEKHAREESDPRAKKIAAAFNKLEKEL